MKHKPTPMTIGSAGELCPMDWMLTKDLGTKQSGVHEIRTVGRVFANGGPEEAKDFAEFIMNACNAYDELIAALEAVYEVLEKGKIDKRSQQVGSWKTYRTIIKEALAKAKGDKPK